MAQQPSLTERAQQQANEFIESLDDDSKQTLRLSMQRLSESDIDKNAKRIGDQAPDFCLPSVKGGDRKLSDYLKEGPVVLSFYRGGWCPYCNLEFKALQECLPEFKQLGATLIGISPETPDNSLSTVEKHNLEFEVLSDVGNRVVKEYGLLCIVDQKMRPLYLDWGIDVPESNGDNSYELPIPATYVIDQKRIIQAAHVDKIYINRMDPNDIVEALKALKK
ncbi:MAG: AhpC/TSA family protein [Gammaproteobacteria bacterium]|nr:AhpC/TSA family protein [Gammaproteobacteria bacterium]